MEASENSLSNALAIATVPYQKWNETYSPDMALQIGTIFPDLNKPFFKADTTNTETLISTKSPSHSPVPPEQIERETLLTQIYETSFVINDLTLFLDTHKEDEDALKMLKSSLQTRKQLMIDFATKFYPLTQACMAEVYAQKACNYYSWSEGPMPWEGACV